jgi:hypothetical protein
MRPGRAAPDSRVRPWPSLNVVVLMVFCLRLPKTHARRPASACGRRTWLSAPSMRGSMSSASAWVKTSASVFSRSPARSGTANPRAARSGRTRRMASEADLIPCHTYRLSIDFHRESIEGETMGKLTVFALRTVLVALLAGSVFVQTVMVALLATDLEESGGDLADLRTPILVITVLGVVTVQVVLVCVWRLVTMVRHGTVFSPAAFRYVHSVIGALVAAALLMFALAVILAPGEAVPPGIVLLMCGAVMAVLGVALIVLVLRMLLAQAVARDIEAAQMQAELAEVI